MNTIIKKITVALLSMIVVAGAFAPVSSVFAASFNNDAKDYATIQVSNYTRNPGSTSNWSNSVSANAGEIVSFLVYYHNTATDAANGTSVRVQLPSGQFTSATVTGDVRSSNASPVSGSASINLSSSQSLTFIPGSVSWYASQSSAARALLNGQNGSEIVSSNGLSIGTIAGGWADQGYVVFRAQVSSNNTNNNNNQQTGSAPYVSTNSASSISQNNATVQGSVNPNNSNTNAWFEYGTTQSFGNTAGNQTVGSGTSNISGYLYNLNPNTTYYYRAVAQNSYGTTYGSIMSFTTQSSGYNGVTGSAPYVSTNSASSISQNNATVQGSVNPNNSNTNAWFEYGTTQSFGSTIGYQTVGANNYATNVSGYLSNLSPNTTYYYRVVAQNSYGTTYGSAMSFTTQSYGLGYNNGSAPLAYTSMAGSIGTNSATFNGSINPNSSYTNAWFEYGVNQSLGYTTGYQAVGSNNYALTITASVANLAPNTTYYYRVAAQNSFGTSYGTIVSFTTNGGSTNYNYTNGTAPFVTSREASAVYRNTALVNGNVNPNGSLSTAWFEWGATASLGNRTMVQPVGQANYADSYSFVLSGLQAGTTYYYRAVAQNAYGTTNGDILNFTTTANRIVPVVVTNETAEPRIIVQQISGTQSGAPTVILTPSIDKKNLKAGDTIEYSIQYRNDGAKAITNSKLKVVLPSEVDFDHATLQPSLVNGNELTFDLGTIPAHSQGVITITAKIARTVETGSALTFGATLDYVNSKKQFQSTSTYLTVLVEAGVAGLASLFSVLGNLLTNWFVDLILGLLIGFGIYHFFVRQKEEEVLIK